VNVIRAGTVQIFIKMKTSQTLYIMISYPEFYPNWSRHMERVCHKCVRHTKLICTQTILFFIFKRKIRNE